MQNRTKHFIKNLLFTFGIAVLATILLSYDMTDIPNAPFDLNQGVGIVGVFSTIILCFKLSLDFTDKEYPTKD